MRKSVDALPSGPVLSRVRPERGERRVSASATRARWPSMYPLAGGQSVQLAHRPCRLCDDSRGYGPWHQRTLDLPLPIPRGGGRGQSIDVDTYRIGPDGMTQASQSALVRRGAQRVVADGVVVAPRVPVLSTGTTGRLNGKLDLSARVTAINCGTT